MHNPQETTRAIVPYPITATSTQPLAIIQQEISQINLLFMVDHCGNHHKKCIYCGEKFNKKDYFQKKTRDHIVPKIKLCELSTGFKAKFFQLFIVPCCNSCNQIKGAMSLMEMRTYVRKNKSVRNRMRILKRLELLIA